MKPIIYVSSPYSIKGTTEGLTDTVLEERWNQVTKFVAWCQMVYIDDYIFYGPITHSHPMAKFMPPSYNTYDFWVKKIDESWVQHAEEVWVLMMKGWDKSLGVTRETQLACELGKKVRYFDAVTYSEIAQVEEGEVVVQEFATDPDPETGASAPEQENLPAKTETS